MKLWQRLVIGGETLLVLGLAFLNLGGSSDHSSSPSSSRRSTTTAPCTILTTSSTSTSTTTTTTTAPPATVPLVRGSDEPRRAHDGCSPPVAVALGHPVRDAGAVPVRTTVELVDHDDRAPDDQRAPGHHHRPAHDDDAGRPDHDDANAYEAAADDHGRNHPLSGRAPAQLVNHALT